MRHLLIVIASVLALPACQGTHKGTETGNPNMVEARIASAAWSSEPALVSAGPGGAIAVDRAWLWVEKLDFLADGACAAPGDEEQDEESGAAPVLVELLGGVLQKQKLDRTTYCAVDLAMDSPADAPTTAPEGLDAATLIVEGSLSDGTPFRVRSDESLDARLVGSFAVDVGGADLALAFDLAGWFDGIDLASLPSEGGVLALGEEEEVELAAFQTNFTRSVGLFADQNANGALDPGDTSEPPLAEP